METTLSELFAKEPFADFIFAILSFQKVSKVSEVSMYSLQFNVFSRFLRFHSLFLKNYCDLVYEINQPVSLSLKRSTCDFFMEWKEFRRMA